MNKLFTFLASAALISLSACSSDDPAVKGPDKPDDGNGTTMYLAVEIIGANSASRAEGETTPTTGDKEGSYNDGESKEIAVNDAKFYYFDAKGNYMAEATVWKDEGNSSSTEKPNVTLESSNVLILRNIKDDRLPKYLITVLNAPSSFTDAVTANEFSTIEEMRKKLVGIYKNDYKNLFVMTTTSFYGGDTNDYDDNYYYANVIKKDQLIDEDPNLDPGTIEDEKTMKIYVERLAAKFSLGMAKTEFPLKVSIGGNVNDGKGGTISTDASGHTQVYVKIEKFDVTNVEGQSYLSKNIDGFNTTAPWADGETAGTWNLAANHRSFWGMSPKYGENDGLTGPKYAEVAGTETETGSSDPFKAVYSCETTKALDFIKMKGENNELLTNLDYQQTPNFVIIASVYCKDKDDNRVDVNLVQEGSLYYTEDQYIQYTLNRVNTENKLNFYKYTGTTESEDKKNKVSNYEQVKKDDFKVVRYGTDNSRIRLATTIAGESKLYKKVKDGTSDKMVLIEANSVGNAVAQLNANINSLFTEENSPTGFTKGKMQYFIPVEHLLGTNADNRGRIVNKLGEYGVVRNHWYKLEIDEITGLGRGLFDPDHSTEILKPDKENPKNYAMKARIKILSWKIVKQNVKL